MSDVPPPLAPLACNICGGDDLTPRGTRGNMLCGGCGSDGRTRLLWLILNGRDLLRPGRRCLHIAPEAALAGRIRAILGDGYEPVDIEPERFPFAPGIKRFDLIEQAASLPSERYDLILHSHVMEHLRGNVTAVLFHLHRALKPDGRQVCCIPVVRGRHYAEDLGPLDAEDAKRRFGQEDHLRIFGREDLPATLGMIFALPTRYDLLGEYDEALLRRHGIPEVTWRDWSASSVLVLGKDDLLLKT
jgi:phosphoglycolate phosphatase